MVAAYPGINQDWLFGFCWYFFGIKLFMTERVHSEMRKAVLEALFFNKAESGGSTR